MLTEKRWTVDIYVDEQDGRTYAEARLQTGVDTHLVGIGRAKLNPADRDTRPVTSRGSHTSGRA